MIIIVGLISILSSIQLLCKIPLNIPFALLATFVSFVFFVYKGLFKLQECLISVLYSSLCCLISSYIFDFSWDGQAYHQLSVLMFSEGWNPYWDAEKLNTYYDDIWVYGYPKAFWIFSASIYELTHNILTGKAYNLILTSSTLLLCVEAYKKILPNHIFVTYLLSFLTTFNPIVICQLLTYYIDSTLYLLIIDMVIITYLWIINKQNIHIFTLSIVIILMCNTKFTGAVYAIIISLALIAIIHNYRKSQLKTYFHTLFISGLIGILIIGFNPYITNFWRHGNIGWPIMGNNKIDIVTPQGPNELISKNRFMKLLISNNSYAHNDNNSEPILKLPGQIGKYEYTVYGAPDVRIGGFGPFYNIIFIYTLIMVCIILINKSIQRKEKYLIIGLIISILSNPECWWARYIPQMYFLSIVTIIVSYKAAVQGQISRFFRYFCYFCITILSINIVFVSAGSFRNLYTNINEHSANIERLISSYKDNDKELYVIFHKLDSRKLSIFQVNDIKILDSKKMDIPKGYVLFYKDEIMEIYKPKGKK